MNPAAPSDRPPRTDPELASAEIAAFLRDHDSSCAGCGLILRGCRLAECPACRWRLDLAALKEREATVVNIVRGSEWLCPCCGYNLRGSSGDACPECGTPLSAQRLVDPHAVPSGWKRPKTSALVVGLLLAWGAASGTAVVLGGLGLMRTFAGGVIVLSAGAATGVGSAWYILHSAAAARRAQRARVGSPRPSVRASMVRVDRSPSSGSEG